MHKFKKRLRNVLKSIDDIELILSSEDLKGLSAVRNYIAHDYDSTDDLIIEDVIRYNFPILKSIILEILDS